MRTQAPGEPEAALATRTFFQHFGAEDVRRHQIGSELDAAGVKTERGAHRVNQLGFREARHAHQEAITTRTAR